MKAYTLITIALCSTISLCAETMQPETTTLKSTTNETSAIDQPAKPSVYDSFHSLIRSLTSLVASQSIYLHYGVKVVEETITNIIKTSFQLIKTGAAKLSIHKDGKVHVDLVNPDIQEEMMAIIAQQTTRVVIAQYPSDKQKQNANDEEDDQVLTKFAGIVGHFFNILQAPNNPQNVAPNLLGMLHGIVEIGKEVMTRSNLNIDSDEHEIAQYVAQLDDTLKENMFNVVVTQSQESIS